MSVRAIAKRNAVTGLCDDVESKLQLVFVKSTLKRELLQELKCCGSCVIGLRRY
jgi:hypothetical protein